MILGRYKQYFKDLLTTQEPQDEEEVEIQEGVLQKFREILEKSKTSVPPRITSDEVRKAVRKIKRKKAADRQGWKGEWLLEGGEEMINSLVILYNMIQSTMWIPEQWNSIIIKSLHKKGPKKDLTNKRGIFLANILYKTFERIILARNEDCVDEMLSSHQCGGRKGFSTSDNIMVLSALVERNRYMGQNTYLFFADAVKCFDKLWLENCLLNMHEKGFPIHDTALLYHLNHKAMISVNTPFGKTEDFTVHNVVKQGTISGPLICGSEVDQVNKISEVVAVPYGPEVFIGMPEYVDDVSTIGEREDIRKGIRNCRQMEKYKFNYGLDKTKYMVIKTGIEKPELVEEKVKEGVVQETKEYKYVGLYVDEKGTLSTHLDFLRGKARNCMRELMSTGHEANVGKEALRVKLKLLVSTITPALLNDLEVWEGTTPREYEELERIQSECLKRILCLPVSTPYYGILMETGLWPLENLVWYRKLMLFHRIVKSKDGRLGKIIWNQQRKYGMPNSFDSNVKKICRTLELNCEPSFIESLLKSTWKRSVKLSISNYLSAKFHPILQSMTKLRFIKDDSLVMKEYIEYCPSYLATKIITIRLNMSKVKENYRRKNVAPQCRLSHKTEENTEHMLMYPMIEPETINVSGLKQTDNFNIWKNIVHRVDIFEKRIEEIERQELQEIEDQLQD